MQKLLLRNPRILSPAGAFAKGSILVNGEQIEAVSAREHAACQGQTGEVREINLSRCFVVPGFVDTHFHLTSLALKSSRCDLSVCHSADDVYARLRDWVASDDSTSVVGVEWDESFWADATWPTRLMLDKIESKRPLLARRICSHLGVANTVLLRKLRAQSSADAFIDDDTGVLREEALWLASGLCEPDHDKLVAGFDQAIQTLHEHGVTAIHDIVSPTRIDAYAQGVAQSKRPLRIDVLVNTEPGSFYKCRAMFSAVGSRGVRVVGTKCFLDGSIGAETAALSTSYASGESKGALLMSDEELQANIRAGIEGGYVCAMHAIGDRAIDQALAIAGKYPSDNENFRIEHAELIRESQLPALRDARVMLCMQPNFARNWGGSGGLYEKRMGTHRFLMMNPFRTLLNAGIEFVFGSDGMPAGPMYGLKGAIEHPVVRERLSPKEAFDRYGRRPNALTHHERNAGILERGRLADLVVLDKNPFENDLDNIRVVMTMVGGEIVHSTKRAARAA